MINVLIFTVGRHVKWEYKWHNWHRKFYIVALGHFWGLHTNLHFANLLVGRALRAHIVCTGKSVSLRWWSSLSHVLFKSPFWNIGCYETANRIKGSRRLSGNNGRISRERSWEFENTIFPSTRKIAKIFKQSEHF